MESKVLKCPVCGVTRSSKFAMKRHQKNEHVSTASACPIAAATAALSQQHTRDTRQVVRKAKPRHGSDRSLIDQIVHRLVSRHRRHPTYFRQSSEEIARELRQGTRHHQFDHVVYLAIAVTAKVFAGGKHRLVPCARVDAPTVASQTKPPELHPPCVYPISTPAAVTQGVRRRGRRGDPSLDPVRRVLFRSTDAGSVDVPPAPEVHVHNEDDEESWRVHIWESYGTQQIKPPSPMGFRWAPETIFVSSSAAEPPTTPLGADQVIWGPDSPDEPLEEDSVPEVPGWPLFQENGETLRRESTRRRARLAVWRHERTQSSPLRVTDGIRRPSPVVRQEDTSLDDVRLPSPPMAGLASLMKIKRELARSKYPKLPRHRRKCDAAGPTTRSAKQEHTSSTQCTVDIDIHAPEDIF